MEEDDIPPLEDMSEYVDRLKMVSNQQLQQNAAKSKSPTASVDRSLLKLEEDGPGLSRPDLLITTSTQNGKNLTAAQNSSNMSSKPTNSSGFGGLKKGFLSGGDRNKQCKAKSKKEAAANIPLLQGKKDAKDSLCLEEVQEELKKTHPLLSTKEWMTEDLLSKIDQNPTLSRAFRDPTLFKVLEEFHKNPQQALAAAQHNPEVKEFLQQFCSLMGDHFTAMADKQESSERPLISEQLSEEEKHVRDLLSNPDVKSALLDPDIVKLMETLKSNPDEAQRFLRSIESNPRIRSKLKVLVDNGLLSIQST